MWYFIECNGWLMQDGIDSSPQYFGQSLDRARMEKITVGDNVRECRQSVVNFTEQFVQRSAHASLKLIRDSDYVDLANGFQQLRGQSLVGWSGRSPRAGS